MIDTHCHLTFPDFAGRTEDILADAAQRGVTGAISISTTSTDCLQALALAQAHERIWCTAGIHPLHSHEFDPAVRAQTGSDAHNWANLRRVIEDPECVAWGELGLDLHYDGPHLAVQDRVLDEHLAFIESCRADGIDKPVVIHCREAYDELIPVLKATSLDPARFVFHCFTAGPSEARAVLDFGAMISFTGVLTYKNAPEVREAAKLVPDDRVMVETDAPFLSPEPHRGVRPCRPSFTRDTAEHLAKVRGADFDALHERLNANTRAFFGVDAR